MSLRQIKFVNFKKRFPKFRRKITGYADMLMVCINLPVHGYIQEFSKETVFLKLFFENATMVGKEKIKKQVINDKWEWESYKPQQKFWLFF